MKIAPSRNEELVAPLRAAVADSPVLRYYDVNEEVTMRLQRS